MLPGWQQRLAGPIAKGELVVVGVVQEQHPARARLYKQWRKLSWPIFVDALNSLGHAGVPFPIALDEAGRVVHAPLRANQVEEFLARQPDRAVLPRPPLPHPLAGDALFWKGKLNQAVKAYRKLEEDPDAVFRLGVALRRRYESKQRKPGDAQAAVDAWTRALALRPNQYIWRRRIQLFGPRLDKPYNLYGWVAQARAEIRARGEKPVALPVEPRGTEVFGRGEDRLEAMPDADPEAKIAADAGGLIGLEVMAAPARVRPGRRLRVRLTFRAQGAFWNNEADPLSVTIKPGAGLKVVTGTFVFPNANKAETEETRILELELAVDPGLSAGVVRVPGYALYNVCERESGVCRYLRREFAITITVDKKAPRIQ